MPGEESAVRQNKGNQATYNADDGNQRCVLAVQRIQPRIHGFDERVILRIYGFDGRVMFRIHGLNERVQPCIMRLNLSNYV